MHELHAEQASLRRSRRKYELPDIRTGDVVRVTYYESCVHPPRALFSLRTSPRVRASSGMAQPD